MVARKTIVASDMQDMDQFLSLQAWVRASRDRHADWYEEAEECFEFTAGRQWSEADKLKMIETFRQPIEFNRIGPIVDAICGMEINNRQEVKYLPRTMGEAKKNERLSSLADWAREQAQAEDEESAAFRDAVICGRGWVETRLSFDEEPTGKIVVDRIDPMESGVDPASRKANFSDARYVWRYRDIDTKDAEEMFPDLAPSALHAHWAATMARAEDGGEGNKRDYPEETRAALKNGRRPKTVRIVQIEWWEKERAYLVDTGEGPQEKSADEWAALEKRQAMLAAAFPDAPEWRAAPIMRRIYKQAFLGATGLLKGGEGDAVETIAMFTITAITGRWDRNEGYHYGVVRPMLGPQMLANKTLAQTLHILNTNARGGLLAEKGAFANIQKAEAEWANPSKIIEVNEGVLSSKRIQDRTAPQMPQILAPLQEFSISSIRDVVGVNVEMLGAADRDQPASLEYQRRQSAVSILAPLFDGLRRYRKTQGHILIDCLRRLPPGVLVRVIADEQAQGQEQGQPQEAFQAFDPAEFGLGSEDERFDVIVDESPSSPNMKEQAWSAMQPFVAGLAQNPAAVAVLLKYSPLPSSAAIELAEAIKGGGQPQIPPEVGQMIEQGKQEIAALQQQLETMKADKAIAAHEAETRRMGAETDREHKLAQLGDQGKDDSGLQMLKMQFEQDREERKQQFDLIIQTMKDRTAVEVAEIGAQKGMTNGY